MHPKLTVKTRVNIAYYEANRPYMEASVVQIYRKHIYIFTTQWRGMEKLD